MQWIETSGKNEQEAVESALFQLGISRSELEYTVVSEPKRGLLGIMRGEARIRARVKPTTYKPKEGPGRRTRSTGAKTTRKASESPKSGGGKKEPKERSKEPKESTSSKAKAGPAKSKGSDSKGGEPAKGRAGATAAKGRSTGAEEAPDNGTGRGSRAGRGSSERGGTRAAESGSAPSARSEDGATGTRKGKGFEGMETDRDEQTIERVTVPLEAQAELAIDFLEGLLDEFDLDGEVGFEKPDEDTVVVGVTGDELGLLIGPKAATLSAVQELTRTVVQRKTGASNGRLLVDVAGYRAKRKVALTAFAERIAAEVIASGAAASLEPMNPADRKVIHDTISGIDGVATRSDGEEPRRRVVVLPAG